MHSDPFLFLLHWYALQCNGVWEHDHGIRLETIDNPGWQAYISVQGTNLEDKNFEKVSIKRSVKDWFFYSQLRRFQSIRSFANISEMASRKYNS